MTKEIRKINENISTKNEFWARETQKKFGALILLTSTITNV